MSKYFRLSVLLIVMAAFVAACGGGHHNSTTTVTKTVTASVAPTSAVPLFFCATQNLHNAIMQCNGRAAIAAPSPTTKAGSKSAFPAVNGTDTYGGAVGVATSSLTHFNISYLSGVPGKDWTRGDLDFWHQQGKPTGFVWEQSAAQAENGCGQGTLDAEKALAEANALGAPPYSVIHAAVDTDASGASVKNYFICWEHVLGPIRAGDYGSYFVVRDLNEWGIISSRATWETRAWSAGMLYGGACLYQSAIPPMDGTSINGTGVDIDQQLCPDAGLYPYAQPPKINPLHYAWLPDTRRTFHVIGNTKQLCNVKAKHEAKGCHTIRTREQLAAKRFDHTGCVLDKTTHHFKRLTCKVVAQHLRLLAGRLYTIAHKTENLKHKAKTPRWGATHYKFKSHTTTLGGAYRQERRRYTTTAPITSWS